MAISSSTKFGIVYSTPSDFISKIGSQTNTDGKLYVLHGTTSAGITQGIYMVEENSSDPDGSTNVQMLSSGALASANNAGLMSKELFSKLNNVNFSDYLLADNYVQVSSTAAGYVPKADASDGTIDSATTDLVLTSNNGSIGWYKLPANAFKNDNTTYNSGNVITIDTNRNINHNTSGVTAGRYGDTGETRTLAFGGTFKVVDASVNSYGHVTAISTKTLTLPSKPSTAGTADKVAQTFDVSFNGADILTYNGSSNKILAFVEGTNIDISNSGGTLTIATKNVPTTTEMNTAINSALTSVLKYKNTVDGSNSKLPTTHSKGDVYVASAAFTTTTAETGVAYNVESGDYFISNGSTFDVVNGENQVSNKNATLTIGSSKTVATVDGTDITISLPSSGYYTHPASISGNTIVNTSDGGDFAFSSTSNSIQVITGALRDASGHISKLVYKDVTLPATAYSDTKYTHPASISGTTLADSSLKTTTATNIAHSGTFTVATGVYRDASGHISKVATETFKLPAIYSHPAAGTGSIDTPSTTSTATTLLTRVKIDSSGHVTDTSAFNGTVGGTTTPIYFNAGVPTALSYTIAKSVPSTAVFTDTKVTDATSTSKAFILGHASQGSNATALTNASCYMSGGYLYSGDAIVATQAQVEAATVYWETL